MNETVIRKTKEIFIAVSELRRSHGAEIVADANKYFVDAKLIFVRGFLMDKMPGQNHADECVGCLVGQAFARRGPCAQTPRHFRGCVPSPAHFAAAL